MSAPEAALTPTASTDGRPQAFANAGLRLPGTKILILLILTLIAIAAISWSLFGNLLSQANAKVPSLQESRAEISKAKQADLLESTKGALAATLAEGEQARLVNAKLPFSSVPVQAAAPFSLAGIADPVRMTALKCLTQAVYYEAGYEPAEGRRAVAQVVLNRMRHPAFPKSVCGVVYEGSNQRVCQFSFTCDGSLNRKPSAAAWAQAQTIAGEALRGHVASAVGQATHYHTDYVAPYWAPKLHKIRQIGAHIFYRWPGAWGLKGAFTGRYAGVENLSSPVVDTTPGEEADVVGDVPTAVAERRADNDIGGRLDTSKAWTLKIPSPTESRGRLADLLAAQERKAPAAVAASEAAAAGRTQ